jgi:hypothetical protein
MSLGCLHKAYGTSYRPRSGSLEPGIVLDCRHGDQELARFLKGEGHAPLRLMTSGYNVKRMQEHCAGDLIW